MSNTYKVDGMHMDTYDEAMVVATRLYERYDKTRTIKIMAINHFDHGSERVYEVLEAVNEPESRDPDTLEMFS